MPKNIELTVEIDVQCVSCPGVWLCQDGRVSLTVFALGTSYQTCLLPPTFPLMFKDVFYFRKRFQESCALNNICCLLKDETIYCELVQWCDGCTAKECGILAQYLGALNDVLFPPNMCSNDGVDLLMRRSKEFPGILSPKIEIATKVRIDEVWNQPCKVPSTLEVNVCQCTPRRQDLKQTQIQVQQQVCHTARYHRNKCYHRGRTPSLPRSRSRSDSSCSRSGCNLTPKKAERSCPKPKSCMPPPRRKPRRTRQCRDFCVYNVRAPSWTTNECADQDIENDDRLLDSAEESYDNHMDDANAAKTVIESRYIEHDKGTSTGAKKKEKTCFQPRISPCICEICKRYHELFHTNTKSG